MAQLQREQTKGRQPPQQQEQQPGIESQMQPRPRAQDPNYHACGKLENRVAINTGGDSGIGRAVAIAFVFSYFFMTQAALPHLKNGSSIINTTSVTAYRGSPQLLDYSSTKGAIVAFTRSLAKSLVNKGIRVNGVAPGPIWTPLIPSTESMERVSKFGDNVPMERAGQPEQVAPSFVFLAAEDSSYMAGQILHPSGGEVVNG